MQEDPNSDEYWLAKSEEYYQCLWRMEDFIFFEDLEHLQIADPVVEMHD